MSRISQDVLGVMRGLQKVAEAGRDLQIEYMNHLWRNSSIRELTKNTLNSLNTTNTPNKFESFIQTVSESASRVNSVVEGAKEYTKYATGTVNTNFRSEFSRLPDIETENPLFKLTPNEKALLDQIDSEYARNILDKKRQKRIKEENINKLDTNSIKTTKVETKAIPKRIMSKSRPKLSENAKEQKVPSSRLARMVSFGTLAAGLGLGTAAEAARRTFGVRSSNNDENSQTKSYIDNLFLSPANMDRIVNTLCKVRGAALKIGQLLSIQDDALISPQLARALERVRQSADFMPQQQVEEMMSGQLGVNWRTLVAEFDMRPFAAASIGQVHWAKLHDGTEVAIKIQYPGVARGIQSDIDNLVGVLKVWNVFPPGMFIDNLVTVAKRELAWEVDYKREAECTKKFRQLLEPYPEYYVPRVIDELCSDQIFTTELVEGTPVDKCVTKSEEIRKFIATKSMELILRELMEFQYMQTDPNWSNFLYNEHTNQLILLDFGASREYSKQFMDRYIRIIQAAVENDRQTVLEQSQQMGFLTGYETKIMEEAHIDAVMIFGEIFRTPNEFNFSTQKTTEEIVNLVPVMLQHRLCPPPEEIYSLHRKLSGIFLLCSKMKVAIKCQPIFLKLFNNYQFDDQIKS